MLIYTQWKTQMFLNNEATNRNELNRVTKARNKETKNDEIKKRRNVFRGFVPAFRCFVSSFRCFIVSIYAENSTTIPVIICYALLHIYQLYFEPRSLDITMLYSTSNALPDNQFFISLLHTAHVFLKRVKN